MSTTITFDEALAYMHPMEDLDEVKKNLESPQDIARNIWTLNKEHIILMVRNNLKNGGYKYHFNVTDCNDEIVSYLKVYFENEFKPSGACIYYSPPRCNEPWSYLTIDHANLNRELVIQMQNEDREFFEREKENERKKSRFIKTGMIIGSIALAGVALYMRW